MQITYETRSDHANAKPKRALRLNDVLTKVGISRTQLYRLISRSQFPRQFHLSERTAVWDEGEVDAWLHTKQGER